MNVKYFMDFGKSVCLCDDRTNNNDDYFVLYSIYFGIQNKHRCSHFNV